MLQLNFYAFLFECNFIYLDVTFLDLSVLDVLPEVVADGSEGGMHFYAEITSESNGSFVLGAFLFIWEKTESFNKGLILGFVFI